jgi:hypothetical protein
MSAANVLEVKPAIPNGTAKAAFYLNVQIN